jgi:hypothetical protein
MTPAEHTVSSVTDALRSRSGEGCVPGPASPKRRRVRPGWKATLVRRDTFRRLRAIQKSMIENPIDLSYLCEACLRIALDIGAEEIVKRAALEIQQGMNHSQSPIRRNT